MILNAMNCHVQQANNPINVHCPACHQGGTFDVLSNSTDAALSIGGHVVFAGYRRCPNINCKTLVFFASRANELLFSYPAERIDFDTTNIPAKVVSALEEAITCHAHECYIASAMLIRKSLEELCLDRGASGANLKEKIKDLRTKVVLPQELLDGVDDLRLLGNDAAHVASQEYNTVGKQEVEIGIEFAKEVLKAVYQYSALLAKLKALKKP